MGDAMDHRFDSDGFLLVPGLLEPSALDPLQRLIERRVDELARSLQSEGRIADIGAGLGFTHRLDAIARQTELPGRQWDEGIGGSDELRELAEHPALVDAVASVLGPDVGFSGDWHLRPKLPDDERTAFPWHQDSQYYGEYTRQLHIVTAWIPLVDVDERNGCLRLIPGSREWGLQPGSRRADYNMVTPFDVERLGAPISMPMRRGDVLLFHNLTYHGSGLNQSGAVRWSVDLRYDQDLDPATLPPEQAEAWRSWDSPMRRSRGRRPLRGRGLAAATP
jgi:hypothetical protein